MNGLIFLGLDDFVESRLGKWAWLEIMASVDLEKQEFHPDHTYPDAMATDLFGAVAARLGIPVSQMLEQFGRHLAPGLVKMGQRMGLVKNEWKTIDIIECLQNPILTHFSDPDGGVPVPEIRTYRLRHSEVAVAYVSERKLCHLFKGIVLGMGAFFDEPIAFKEPVCMLHGHAPLCRLSVYLDDPDMVRYVDIRREFEIVHSRIDEIIFFNIFGGIPFVQPGLVLRFNESEVVIQAPREQLIAMEEEGITFIAVPHLPIGLQAEVKSIDLKQGLATLHHIVLTNGAVGQRLHQRVVSQKPFSVKIKLEEKEYSGEVMNLSKGGIKVALSRSLPLDESLLFVPVTLIFSLPLKWLKKGDTLEFGAQYLILDGNILDIYEEKEKRMLRIVFSALSEEECFLIDQYYQSLLEKVQSQIDSKLRP